MTIQANHIPEGDFQLIITFLPSDAPKMAECAFSQALGIQSDSIAVLEGEHPYCEVQLCSANLREVATQIAQANINADIQVLPPLKKQWLGFCMSYNAYVRQGEETGIVHINEKSHDNTAYELTLLLEELNAQGITQADELIKSKIQEFHPYGWV